MKEVLSTLRNSSCWETIVSSFYLLLNTIINIPSQEGVPFFHKCSCSGLIPHIDIDLKRCKQS